MTPEKVQVWLFTGAFIVAFVVGFASSWRLRMRYERAKYRIEQRNRTILKVIVLASWMITLAAGWFGGLSAFRLITDLSIPWTPPITLAISTAIVFIPLMFDIAVSRVARIEEDN